MAEPTVYLYVDQFGALYLGHAGKAFPPAIACQGTVATYVSAMTETPDLQGIFRTDIRARAAYSEGAGIYRILPSAVARPTDQEDLAALIRWAEATGTGLIPRGAGSGIPGGSIGPGVLVDLRDYVPSRLEIDPEQRTAVTGAGVSLRELNTAAARHGLRLPPDPSSGTWATLGGMVATNASGARSVRYGSVRRWVTHLELVGKEGRVMRPTRRLGGRRLVGSAARRHPARELGS